VRRASTALLAAALPLLAAQPAFAVQEWYDYYLQARDSDIPSRRWADCLKNLERAQQLRPSPGNNVRTYGVIFIDYLPSYYRGVCLLRQERFDDALLAFDAAEREGAVKRAHEFAGLGRLRAEAQSGRNGLMVVKARAEVDRLLREARELGRRASYDEALALLKQAEALAKGLDAERLRAVTAESERLRAAQKDAAAAAARSQRLEQRLADGQRLLQEGKASDAMLAFNEALDVDPHEPRALAGRDAAQAAILGSTTRARRREAGQQGKAFFDAGQYEQALGPLTYAAADPENAEARALLARILKIQEGTRKQKELRLEIERLFARGEALMKEARFPDAQVAFEAVLGRDPGHAAARERLAEAAARTGAALFARWLPNEEPTLSVFEPQPRIEAASVLLQGVANDDRGLQRIEFRVGDRLVGEIVLPTVPPAEPVRQQQFVRELPLQPGPNAISVSATDNAGLVSRPVSFGVERRLRFYETRYFLPAALAGAFSLVGLGWGAQRVRRRRAQRLRFNPYIAGAPVLDDQMFYGREKLTRRMLSTLNRNSLMITGERRIGKTTFLHHLKRVLAEDQAGEWRFFPVFVDLQGVPEQLFFHAMMAEIVDGLSLSAQTREALRFRLERQGYEARDFSHDLPAVLAELKTRSERKVKLALLIDEVDVLNEYSESVNQRLRGIFMKSFSENLVAVMSGVAIRRRWKSEVSPWYNFFDEIELAPFTREEAEALVREPVAGVFRFRPAAVERILELSRLRPYFVQKYCVHAVSRMLEQGRSTISVDDVEAARQAVELEGPPGGEAEPQPARPTPVAD
jgi:tetratricopeptide (TPR) repeat protein